MLWHSIGKCELLITSTIESKMNEKYKKSLDVVDVNEN